jgi:two-component system heavy metal sensor histidine kinase CusS
MSWKFERPASLAVRLSAWYAVSSFLLLAAGSGFLYWKLAQNVRAEDTHYLLEKAAAVKALLAAGDINTLRWEVEDESSVLPEIRLLSRISRPNGTLVLESSGIGQLPPSLFPARGRIENLTIHNRPKPKHVYDLLSSETPGYKLQFALETTTERQLLASYRDALWIVLSAGLLLAAWTGYRIARRGIEPIEEVTSTVRLLRSSTLHERISVTGMPAEIRLLALTFNETLDELENAFGRLSRFSSDIAHELRTPIGNLRGEIEVTLGKSRSAGEYRAALESGLEDCVRLSRILESLLFLARAEHPETQIRRETLDVTRELTALCDFYDAAASDAGVVLELHSSGEIAAQFDQALFQRAVGNLVENALAHTSRGGHIRIDAARANDAVSVSVADDGCGIPPEHLDRVFDRFYRVDAARLAGNAGSGLGLAIVKGIATLHGGRVSIESTPGHGTRVTFSMQARDDKTVMSAS